MALTDGDLHAIRSSVREEIQAATQVLATKLGQLITRVEGLEEIVSRLGPPVG